MIATTTASRMVFEIQVLACISTVINSPFADISKYAIPSDLTGKNQTGPMMFSAYRSESPVKICSLLRQETIFSLLVSQTVSLKVDLSCNSMFISLNKHFV